MSELLALLSASFIVLAVVVFGIGALAINLSRKNDTAEPSLPADLRKEVSLETEDPMVLMAGSPRAEELERQSGELADNVRKRIRDRARQTVSRESGTGVADNS